ncbi:SDR family NAD(P)-dependent oxidoreductase [Metapseudomonas furukawaii]
MDEYRSSKLAVVTGASSGIGLATCVELLGQGVKVIAVSRTCGGLMALIQAYPVHLQWFQGDVTDDAVLSRLADFARAHGTVDYLVPNAGVAMLSAADDNDSFERQWKLNGKAAIEVFRALSGLMSPGASVVFVGTFLRQIAFEGLGPYIATKAALSALVKTLALEFSKRGIRINMVSPGPTKTAIWGGLGLSECDLQAVADGVSQRLLTHEFLEPEAVAKVIAFQLSNGASGVFGQDWVVDAGYSLI